MRAAVRLAGVARMLVLLTDRLDEAHRVQVALGRRRARCVLELDLVAEVRTPTSVRAIVRVIHERLVMELEREVRALRIVVRRIGVVVRIRTRRPWTVRPARPRGIPGGVLPPAGVPTPRDAGCAEL